jgi:hypothetical protein
MPPVALVCICDVARAATPAGSRVVSTFFVRVTVCLCGKVDACRRCRPGGLRLGRAQKFAVLKPRPTHEVDREHIMPAKMFSWPVRQMFIKQHLHAFGCSR